MHDNFSFQEIYRGIDIISENMSDHPGIIKDLVFGFNFSHNYYHKLMRLNDGYLERAMKELLYTALGTCRNWKEFKETLHDIMTQPHLPPEYLKLIRKYNLQDFSVQ